MNTLSLTLFLLLGSGNFGNGEARVKRIEQDTTSLKVWKQRAEAAEVKAVAATKEALRQKALAERATEETVRLKKLLEECRGKKKE